MAAMDTRQASSILDLAQPVIVDELAEAVTIRAPDNRLVYANRAALQRLGVATLQELRAADPNALMSAYEAVGEDGRVLTLEDLPSVRLLRGEHPEPLTLRSVDRETGQESWVVLKATAVHGADGEIEAAVTIIEDVTAAKRAALRMEVLARAGRVLAESLDYQVTLRNVAGLAVPDIADWCAVDLFDDLGNRVPVAAAHVDPAKLDVLGRLRGFEPEHVDPERGLGLVWRTGEAVLSNEIPDSVLVESARDAEHLELLRQVGMRAALIVPMRATGQTIGALTLVSAESGRTFNRGDVEFAEQIAERAGLAVENARLYSAREEVARTLEDSLLPEALPEIPGWEVAALYRPAGDQGEVGGDFYDLWTVDGDWLMTIGDITGKGVAAASVTSLVRHTAWLASEYDPQPAQILRRVDEALKRRPALRVCTALCLRIRGEEATVACGGHPPLIRVRRGCVEEVGVYGTLLGAFPNVRLPEASFELAPGELLVAITDGVTDTRGEGDQRFGMERLKEILQASMNDSPTVIRGRLLDALERFQVGPQADDTAIVIMRFTGKQAPLRGQGR
jgi:serine phosphatase RsbU (regulator of sigma subunit)